MLGRLLHYLVLDMRCLILDIALLCMGTIGSGKHEETKKDVKLSLLFSIFAAVMGTSYYRM